MCDKQDPKADPAGDGEFKFVMPAFSGAAFEGTAEHYIRYRPPYPRELFADLLRRSAVTDGDLLLDIATGPGRVALELSPHVREVWAVDLEPEMIDVGKRAARERGLENVRWMVGRAEDLEAPAGSFGLITIGEAFHRLDQRRICAKAREWLKPGCLLATLGSNAMLNGGEPWQKVVLEVVRKWTGWLSPIGRQPYPPIPGGGAAFSEWALRQTGFEDVSSRTFFEPRRWTAESILGFLYSTSICSERVLGAKKDPFEKDLRAALLGFNPSGSYAENASFGYTAGRRP